MKPPFSCLWCEETVAPGDLVHALLPGYHFACALRAIFGPIAHFQRTCSCFVEGGAAEHDPPGLTRRQAARIVADYVNNQHRPQPGRN